jgi:hypothetical protein
MIFLIVDKTSIANVEVQPAQKIRENVLSISDMLNHQHPVHILNFPFSTINPSKSYDRYVSNHNRLKT